MVSTSGFSWCLVLHQVNGPISFVHRLHCQAFNQCLHANLCSNVSKKLALLSEANVPRTSLVIGFPKMNVVASSECGFPSEEEKEPEKFELEADFIEQILPPWGNLENCEDLDFEPGVIDQPRTVLEEKAMLSVDNVHFLEETDEEVLSKRILVLSRTNKPRSALELLGSMELSGLHPELHACNSLLHCLLRNGLVEDALRVFGFMKRKKLTTRHSCSLILKGVADARGCDAALKMFSEMEEDIEVKSGFDLIVYNTMISVCGKANNWLEATRLWRSMRENRLGGTRVTYSVLVCTFVRCGRNDLAVDAYDEMVRSELEPGGDTMQAAITAATKEGKWELALRVFRAMTGRGLVPSAATCNALINSLGKAGEIGAAMEAFGVAKSLGHSPDAYTWNAVLGGLRRAGRHDEALRLFESVERDRGSRPNLHLYNAALVSCSKLGSWARAIQLVWRMEASGVTPSTASYNLVIGACEAARKPRVAVQVYEHMSHRNCDPDTFTRLLMIRVCVWGSLWNELDEILEQASPPDGSLYNAAIQGMCLRGRVDLAKKLYTKLQGFGLQPDGKTRALMLQNLIENPVQRHRRRNYRKQPSFHRRRTRTELSSH